MVKTSRFLSLILRHKPETIGITLDEKGYANVDELLKGMNISIELLEQIVEEDDKQRYSFNEDHTKIRANQGHSIQVDVELEKKNPPDILYHGTATKYEVSILEQGLIPKSRLYVHLSWDMETASKVGSRHGKLIIYQVDAKQMVEDGYTFFLSKNNVWLCKSVPVKYLTKL